MKFEINGDTWIIEEKSLKDLINLYEEANRENIAYCFGVTMKHNHEIYINKEMCEAQKIKTLKHELMHCYLWEYGFYGRDYTEEDVCDLCAGSNDFVNKVIDMYKKDKFTVNKANNTFSATMYCDNVEIASI
jgi:hypothetical protein